MSINNFFRDLGSGITSVFKGQTKEDNLFELNGRTPLLKAIPFGIQHVLAMFAANVTPIIIVFSAIGLYGTSFATYAMSGALFMAGIGTIIQLLIGARLPIVIGTSFTFVPILINIGLKAGGGSDAYYTIMGAIIVGGLIAAFLSIFYRFWGKIIKPIVPAIVVLAIGFSLLSSGASQFMGGANVIKALIETGTTPNNVPYYAYILVAFATLISAILWQLFVKGVWKNIYIFIGIAVGYIISICIPNMVDFSILKIDTANLLGPKGIFSFPKFLDFTQLKFDGTSIALTTICFIIAIVEAIGDISALTSAGLSREPTKREYIGTLIFDGLNSSFGALFGALPLTTFAQNVGIVAQTKVVNRFTIFTGALFLVIVSLFPPIANFIYTIPDAVIGGTMVILFGSIAIIGMKEISQIGFSDKNILILSITTCLGFGLSIASISTNNGVHFITEIFDKIGVGWLGELLSNCVLNMFIISIILSWVLPDSMHISFLHKKKNKENNNNQ